MVAVVSAALFGAMAARFDDSWALPAYLVLTAALVALSAIDLETYLLPNRIVYPLAARCSCCSRSPSLGDGDFGAYRRALLGAAVAFAAFFVLHLVSPRSMGFGDVKLSFTLGLALGWLGWGEVFLGLFLGFLYGAVIGIFLIATALPRPQEPSTCPSVRSSPPARITAILVGDADHRLVPRAADARRAARANERSGDHGRARYPDVVPRRLPACCAT